jgi:CRP/FNR family transcriptional regulator, cyclic AMP receptor protein
VNLYRLIQFQRLVRELQVAEPADLSIQSWIPHMKLRRMKAGETLMRRGDRVDSIYYLLDGQLELPELGKTLNPGAVVSEIGVFASDAKRTATIACRTDCRIYELTENQAKQLLLQDRKFVNAAPRHRPPARKQSPPARSRITGGRGKRWPLSA